MGVIAPALVFLFALALRLIFIHQMKDTPFFTEFGVDPAFYRGLALEILGGNLFPEEVLWQHPFYPYFLAAVYKLFGQDPYILRVVQALIGSAGCVLVYALGTKAFGRAAGTVAGFFAASYGFFIFSEFTLEADFLSVLFGMAALLTEVSARR